ncbi:MAG: GDSL family lipase [Lachnospiraceae bacterium]|nr:GDSL family lipase [Lachnospiraceae bacterium]
MERFLPTDPKIHIYGRTLHKSPLPLFWTASGIEFMTDATTCYLDLECGYESFEQWIRIEIDDFTMIRMVLPKGRNRICVFHDLAAGCKRKVNLWKEVQAFGPDPEAYLLIHGVELEGNLLELPEKKVKLEFVGDSITSGEGLAGAPSMGEDWAPMIFSCKEHYGMLTARALKADLHIVSQSGWGVCAGWDNNPASIIPPYYHQVCGILQGERNRALGAGEENDFSWQPDAVMVNLGTNDCGAFDTPAFTDPQTGIAYKMERMEDGTLSPASLDRFTGAVYDFLKTLRKYNSKAKILWLYGMIGTELSPYIQETVDRFRKETGDEEVYFLELPQIQPEWEGAHHHPGVIHHRKAADVLIGRLEKLLQ